MPNRLTCVARPGPGSKTQRRAGYNNQRNTSAVPTMAAMASKSWPTTRKNRRIWDMAGVRGPANAGKLTVGRLSVAAPDQPMPLAHGQAARPLQPVGRGDGAGFIRPRPRSAGEPHHLAQTPEMRE